MEDFETERQRRWNTAMQVLLQHFRSPSDDDFERPDTSRVHHHSFSSGLPEQPPRVVNTATQLAVSIDRIKLNEAAALELSDDAIEELVTATAIYAHRFTIPHDDMLSEAEWQWIIKGRTVVDKEVRRAYVRRVLEIWRANGGDGNNLARRNVRDKGDVAQVAAGPVVILTQYLLRSIVPPDATDGLTIRHDIEFIVTGIERPH